jgi:hypothetical protein
MAENLSEGSQVIYRGELPEEWPSTGTVVALEDDSSGDQVVTVEFGNPGQVQDILASELERTPADAQHYDDDGNPFEHPGRP